MADFIYPTAYESNGPWLIDSAALDRLDDLIKQEYQRMVDAEDRRRRQDARAKVLSLPDGKALSEEELENRISERIELVPAYRNRQVVRLIFDDDTKLEMGTLDEANRHPGIEQRRVRSVDVDLAYGEIGCRLKLPAYLENLTLDASPENSSVAGDVFTSFRQWVREVQPPWWTRLWDRGIVLLASIVMFYVLLLLLGSVSQVPSHAQAEAHALLEKGLTKGDETKAIALLLSLASNYRPPNEASATTNLATIRIEAGMVFLSFAAIMLMFRPTVVFGIGRGRSALRIWRFYMKFISVTIPLALFGSFILPFFVKHVQDTLHL